MAIAHNILLFPGFLLLLVGILISANLGIRILDDRLPLEQFALPLAVAKISLGLVILTLMHPFLHGRFRRSSTVYSGAALFLLMIGGVIASVFSLILGAFFVLAFIFGFLFSLSHKGYLKAFFSPPCGHTRRLSLHKRCRRSGYSDRQEPAHTTPSGGRS